MNSFQQENWLTKQCIHSDHPLSITFSLPPQHHLHQQAFHQSNPHQLQAVSQPHFSKKWHKSCKRKKRAWTTNESAKLQKLHDELGNQWTLISEQFQDRSQNDVKNHFFSQLRMSLRHLDKQLSKQSLHKIKPLNAVILYKIIALCQEQYNNNGQSCSKNVELSQKIKNLLFSFLNAPHEVRKQKALEIYNYIKSFIDINNKSSKKKQDNPSQVPVCFKHQQNVYEQKWEEQQQEMNWKSKIETTLPREDNNVASEIDFYHTKPQQTSELIAKSPICLSNPLEEADIWREKDNDLWQESQLSLLSLNFWLLEHKHYHLL